MKRPPKLWVWTACGLALAVFLWRVVVPAARNPYTVGFITCYTESRILREDPRQLREIYDDAWFQPRVDQIFGRHILEIAHGQPPTMSLLLLPFAWMSPSGARAAWIAFSVVLWMAGIALLARGLGLPRFAGVPSPIWLAALTTAYLPIKENFRQGQGYVFLFFLLSLSVAILLRLNRRHWWWAGLPLALMVVVKSAGLWLLLALLAARQWRIVLTAVVVGAAAVLVSSTFMGWETWNRYLGDAFHWLASDPSNHVTAYQTLSSLTGHLFVYEATWNPRPVAHLPILAAGLTLAIEGAALLVSVRFHRLGGEGGEGFEERALTLGMFISLLVATAPIGEGYHYVLILPGVVMAWWWAMRRRGPLWSGALLLAATVLICAPQKYYDSPRIQAGWAAVFAYPRVYGAFGLWGWLLNQLRDLRPSARPLAAREGARAMT